jgi:hypothetical protein
MITNITELRIRLETHFDIVNDEAPRDPEGEPMPTALGMALLSVIDLLHIIEKGNWTTAEQIVQAWQNRDEDGRSKPTVVPS